MISALLLSFAPIGGLHFDSPEEVWHFIGYIAIAMTTGGMAVAWLTARRHAEVVTRRSRDEIQAIIDTVPALISYVDRDYVYRWNNRAYERWFRRPLGEITGHSMRELLGEAAFARIQPVLDKTFAGEPMEVESFLPYEGTEPRWVHALYAPHRAADGTVDGVAVAVTDISERRRAEAAVASETEQRRLALAAAGMGTWVWNFADDSLEWSARTYEFFGLPADRPIDYATFLSTVHPGDRERLDAAVRAAVQSPDGNLQIEYRVMTPTGTVHWLLAKGAGQNNPDTGKRVKLAGVLMDVTERVLASERLAVALNSAEAANRAKDAFLAALSHELRTPLTPVLFLAATQERAAEVPENLRQDFAMIRRNIELEARLIDDLLDLTRITRGKLQLEFEPTDVHAVLRRSLELLHHDIASRNIALEVDLAAEQHKALADAVRLQQVFWNVLKNSVKFTPEKGRIVVRSRVVEGRWHLAISDSGLGITPEELPRIFDAFSQGQEASSHRFGGLGLGLAITSLLVREHHGSIWAESAGRNQGATFSIELPLLASGFTVAPALPLTRAAVDGAARRILIVEDHDQTRQTLQRLLGRRGYAVSVAPNVAAARELVLTTDFDLMISDLGLPDGSGHELAEEFARTHNLKAIALSGYGMEEDVSRSLTAGFLAHLTKPLDIEALHAAIAKALGK